MDFFKSVGSIKKKKNKYLSIFASKIKSKKRFLKFLLKMLGIARDMLKLTEIKGNSIACILKLSQWLMLAVRLRRGNVNQCANAIKIKRYTSSIRGHNWIRFAIKFTCFHLFLCKHWWHSLQQKNYYSKYSLVFRYIFLPKNGTHCNKHIHKNSFKCRKCI